MRIVWLLIRSWQSKPGDNQEDNSDRLHCPYAPVTAVTGHRKQDHHSSSSAFISSHCIRMHECTLLNCVARTKKTGVSTCAVNVADLTFSVAGRLTSQVGPLYTIV